MSPPIHTATPATRSTTNLKNALRSPSSNPSIPSISACVLVLSAICRKLLRQSHPCDTMLHAGRTFAPQQGQNFAGVFVNPKWHDSMRVTLSADTANGYSASLCRHSWQTHTRREISASYAITLAWTPTAYISEVWVLSQQFHK